MDTSLMNNDTQIEVIGPVTVFSMPRDILDELVMASTRELMIDYVEKHQPQQVLVSLDRVTLLGSESIGDLIRLATRIRSYGGDVAVCSLSRNVRQVFDICKLIPKVFPAYSSTGEALREWQPSAKDEASH